MTGFTSNLGPKRLVEGSFDPQNPCFARPAVESIWPYANPTDKRKGDRNDIIFAIIVAAVFLAVFL